MATLGSLINKRLPAKEPFENTLGGILSNTIKGIPAALAEVVGQPALRAYAAVAPHITVAGVPITKPIKPETQFQKDLYGTDKPITFSSVGSEFPGVKEKSALAPILGFAASISDLIPGSPSKAFSTIAKSKNTDEILKSLKSLFPKTDEASLFKASDDLVNIKTEGGVKAYLGTFVKSQVTPSTTKATRTGEGLTEEVIEKTPPLPVGSSVLRGVDEAPSPGTIPIGTRSLLQKESALPDNLARKRDLINLDRIAIGENAGIKLMKTIEEIRPEIEKVAGRVLSNSEVVRAAEQSSILRQATSRESTLKSEAALLKTRQNLAAMAEGEGVSKDFIDQLKIVSAEATRRGRELQALGINADPIANTTKGELVKKLLDAGVEAEKIIKASEGVDFTDLKQVTNFFRIFIKPTKTEWLDEYRYINLLSSPRTHIVNAFSNLIQGTILNPATRLVSGAVDFVLSGLTGKERAIYAKEVSPYVRGFLNAIPKAANSFLDALKGKIIIDRPDLARISTNSKILKPFQIVPRMLEASDVLFRTLIEAGEKEALALRFIKQGKEVTPSTLAKIEEQAKETAAYFVFRAPLDVTNKGGQGKVLSAIDRLTSSVYQLRKVPGVKWFVPFVQTPMNILKQGIEYSPLGITTILGAKNKTEQVAKTIIGSGVMLGAASLGLQGRLTWSVPSNPKEKRAFYDSGRQPYSVKMGENWVSYSKLGPIAYPIAMAASMQWYLNENPKASTESSFERGANALGGIAQFFTDQSYLQGLQSILEFTSGEGKLPGAQSVFSSTVGQVIPLSSLQRLVSHVIDPTYRKPEKGFSVKTLLQSVQKDIPFLSRGVPEIEGSQPRQFPLLNAISPVNITETKARGERDLLNIRRRQRNDARLKAIKERASSGKSLGSILSK